VPSPPRSERYRGLERVTAFEAANVDLLQLVARRENEVALGADSADEEDASLLRRKRVGDRQRRHDVPGRSAGCDRDPWL
jgi:hypothetical protein